MRLLPSLGSEPHAYDPAAIRMAILNEAQRCSAVYAKTMTTALRGYLRFLAAADLSFVLFYDCLALLCSRDGAIMIEYKRAISHTTQLPALAIFRPAIALPSQPSSISGTDRSNRSV